MNREFLNSLDAIIWPHCFVPVPNLPGVVAICHDLIHLHHPEYFSRWDIARRSDAEKSLMRASVILCPSRATADDLLTIHPELDARTRVFAEAPSGVDPEADCSIEREQVRAQYAGAAIFLFVGVDWPHKNHRLLIEAALELKKRTSRRFKVVFAGHRRGETLRGAIARCGASDVIDDLGPVSKGLLAALFTEATAFVFPSLCEGFGIPLVEAMQYGTPIVASNRSCIPEVCGNAAVLLSPDSATDWAAEMEHLMTDDLHRRDMSARGAARARDYSWERTWREIDASISGCGEDLTGG
jgi:glycosyltransferase involved in cell wall biosynthesis